MEQSGAACAVFGTCCLKIPTAAAAAAAAERKSGRSHGPCTVKQSSANEGYVTGRLSTLAQCKAALQQLSVSGEQSHFWYPGLLFKQERLACCHALLSDNRQVCSFIQRLESSAQSSSHTHTHAQSCMTHVRAGGLVPPPSPGPCSAQAVREQCQCLLTKI